MLLASKCEELGDGSPRDRAQRLWGGHEALLGSILGLLVFPDGSICTFKGHVKKFRMVFD